jgi:hypothetical protein
MTSRSSPQMPSELAATLAKGGPAMLLTVGSDEYPASAYTWALAAGTRAVRFIADQGSTALTNLERVGRAALHVSISGGLLFLIKGDATLLDASMKAGGRLGLTLWELQVVEVKDQSWGPVRVSALTYEWTPETRDAMQRVERAVYAEMRDWRPEA